MRVLTIGTFDLFHMGHGRLLERAAQFGTLTVGVNSDRFTTAYKGRPAQDERVRSYRVSQHPSVAGVLPNDGPGYDLIATHRPDLLVIGSDWLRRDYPLQLGMTVQDLEELEVGVLYLPRTPGVSTSQLRSEAAQPPVKAVEAA